ncbi:hypothetical protein RGRSB_0242 [cyanobacterium endosymbiont of Rhopalodia gibberula]|uniref:Ig-like domain-containing protein n=1 Tax=cyanobacterium endosymbiont of Rhopalodia gibberula TaxID=1763363 RepID=UPI000DC7174B|nr:Ig-like domain-containing protein [cyanobacterium endosymbiont of Rhopalodia gibberula]BBA78852.1 hypothetical protein RGRSB_0242 [cyanobacterium endosymbiont of Rhopalodia gibberula]
MTNSSKKTQSLLKELKLFDWIALGCIVILSLTLGVVLVRGEQIPLRVSYFSWSGKKIGLQDKAFRITFNRPVDKDSVEKYLSIEPPLSGKMSWQGRQLTYTLDNPPIYGTNYQIKLQNAHRIYDQEPIEPFVSLFSTRDRTFAYIGITEEERGRLILYNITDANQPKKTILTPLDLIITNFRIYPNGNKILFSAYEPSLRGKTLVNQQLYTVTTGLQVSPNGVEMPQAGRLKRILGTKDYQNLSFDLSRNGQSIVIWRINHKNPADSGLWVISDGQKPRPLGVPGGDFVISPDGKRVVISQRGGVGIVPLTSDGGSSEFLTGYEKSLGFSANGKQMLLVRDNRDYTRSLILINRNKKKQELFRTLYPIIDCEFEPREEKLLYCLKTDLVEDKKGKYREEPFLSVIDMEKTVDFPLLALPNYRDVQLSMSPDGVALLFDQVATTVPKSTNDLITSEQQAIADGQVWLLPLPELKESDKTLKIKPEELEIGFKPQWLP